MAQTVGEKVKHAFLQYFVKINEHVAATYEVHFAENAVRHQIMVRKRNTLLEEILDFAKSYPAL